MGPSVKTNLLDARTFIRNPSRIDLLNTAASVTESDRGRLIAGDRHREPSLLVLFENCSVFCICSILRAGGLPPPTPLLRLFRRIEWRRRRRPDIHVRRHPSTFTMFGWPPKDDSKRCRYERLVDFDALDVTVAPAGPRKGLSDHRDRAEAKQTRLDHCGAIR
jgi:hypothetical protein